MQLPSWRVWSAVAALVCAGCAPADAPPAHPVAQAAAPVAADDGQALFLPDLMALLVDPAAGVLLAAGDPHADSEHGPRSAEAWQAVVDAATQLAQAGDLLARPALAQGRSDWLQSTLAVRDAATAGAAAARRRDAAQLTAAAARVRAGCESCHERYATSLPPADLRSR